MIRPITNVTKRHFGVNRSRIPNPSPRVRDVTPPAIKPPLLVYWSLLLFVFTIPLESAELTTVSNVFSLTKLFSIPLFASYFFYHNPFAKNPLPEVPPPMWWFMAYVGVYFFHGLFIFDQLFSEPGQASQFVRRLMVLLQLLIFFWIGSSLLRSQRMMRDVLLAYSIGWFILAFGTLFDLPGFSAEVTVVSGAERVTASGYDPNTMALGMGLAVLALIGLYLNGTFKHFTINVLTLGMTLPMLLVIVKSGSRSGVVAFALGFLVFLLPFWRSHRKLVAWGLAGLVAIGLLYALIASPNFSRRWEQTYYEGSMAGRENLFASSVDLFLQEPLFGWGPLRLNEKLGRDLGRSGADAHNLYFHLLLEVGLLGAVPFFVGLWLCLRTCWKTRTGSSGLLFTSLLTSTLVGNMALTWLTKKPFWMILALVTGFASTRLYQSAVRPHSEKITQRIRARTIARLRPISD